MAFRTPFTPLYADVLDYLNRGSTIRGLPSIAGIFDDYDASKNNRLGIFDEEETTTKSTGPIGIPAAPMNQMRDGNEGQRGIGTFGNLDPNSVKYFNLNGKIVKGYRNLSSGLYQTEEGKNIIGAEEAGISAAGAFPGQGYISSHPFSEGYRGIALKAAEDTRLEQKLAEERLQREREKQAAIEEAERKRLQDLKDLQNKINQGEYGGGGGGPGSTTQIGQTTTPYGGGPGGLHSGEGRGGSTSSSTQGRAAGDWMDL